MEAAWNSINYSFSQKLSSSAKTGSDEKHTTKKETAFVSMIASSISKLFIFHSWQLEQLEGLAPMASLHSAISTSGNRIRFEDSDASNIVLKKLRSKQFDTHRAIYSEYVQQLGLSKRTVLLVLDGALTIHQNNRVKHLQRGQSTVLNHDHATKSACSPESLEHTSFAFEENSFFLLLSEAAIKSVAQTTILSSKVEFSLARDSVILTDAITLGAIGQAPNCQKRVFFPGEVFTAHPTETDDISIVLCGLSSSAKSENVAARLQATCIVRQIAETESQSLRQTVFFATKTKKLKRNLGQEEKCGVMMLRSQSEISAVKRESSEISTIYTADAERSVENPFLKTIPPIPLHFEGYEGDLPRSPSLHKKNALPGLDKSTPIHSLYPRKLESEYASIEDLPMPDVPSHVVFENERPVITKNTAFWGYTPELHEPCSSAKFYWALIRLFVHSCKKRAQNFKATGQPLDLSPLHHFENEGRHWFKFLTVSVIYTLPCNEALVVLNPLLHVITHFATWHNDFCVQAHFRSAKNVENLLLRTSILKCFSCIPEQTRRLLLHRCSFEEWPPGALILCMLILHQFCL